MGRMDERSPRGIVKLPLVRLRAGPSTRYPLGGVFRLSRISPVPHLPPSEYVVATIRQIPAAEADQVEVQKD
jgi:hypothetical protein